MQFRIDKNIPLPSTKAGRKKKGVHSYPIPLLQLEIKDSFFINEQATEQNLKKYKNIARRFCITAKRDMNVNRSFLIDKYEDGIRIWRTK